jgi:hypothetical protein
MPANVVKGKRDERLWGEAKAQARKQYPSASGDDFWAIVNRIYHRMKTRTGGGSIKVLKSRLAARRKKKRS